MQHPTQTDARYLRTRLRYEPDTGKLFWREVGRDEFANDQHWKRFNAKYAGKAAGAVNGEGYLFISIHYKRYSAHRIAWAIQTGDWPKNQIDHINGDRADNRIENLRDVTQSENGKNQRRNRFNKSGRAGVCWHRRDGRWTANIRHDGRLIHLGNFADFSAAAAAREAAEKRFGFHCNHGR
jgi:hypothetical protein